MCEGGGEDETEEICNIGTDVGRCDASKGMQDIGVYIGKTDIGVNIGPISLCR